MARAMSSASGRVRSKKFLFLKNFRPRVPAPPGQNFGRNGQQIFHGPAWTWSSGPQILAETASKKFFMVRLGPGKNLVRNGPPQKFSYFDGSTTTVPAGHAMGYAGGCLKIFLKNFPKIFLPLGIIIGPPPALLRRRPGCAPPTGPT